ncbi:MAG TPA: DUF5320 domain-containing protein [Treponemataceae bacterium]|nr:DUF5320 domain-containing protein [Treponemataceae bacterium]
MPNRNGTGPLGAGPLTGRGMGPCGGYGRASYGRGLGMGFGGGRGFGFGRGRGWFPFANTNGAISADDEKQALNSQISLLTEEIDAIKKRIEELNS